MKRPGTCSRTAKRRSLKLKRCSPTRQSAIPKASPPAGTLASAKGVKGSELIRTFSGACTLRSMEDTTFAAAKCVCVKRISLGDIRAVFSRRIGVITRASANGAPVTTVSERIQGSPASKHPSSPALKTAELSSQVTKIGSKETCATGCSCKGRQKEGQVARKTALTVVPAFAVYQPSAANAIPCRIAQLFAIIAGTFYMAKSKAIARAGKTVQRDVAVTGREQEAIAKLEELRQIYLKSTRKLSGRLFHLSIMTKADYF